MQISSGSYRAIAMRGAAVTGAAQVAKVVLQIVSTVVLSRLLQPTDFGIVAMVAPIVAFATLFQDLGLQQAIVQARTVTAEQISRMFWINFMMSSAVAVILISLAPVAGWFYSEPRVVLLTALSSIPLLLGAVTAQHLAILNRTMRFRAIAAIDVASSTLTLLIAALFAWLLHSYWALWLSIAAGALTTAGLSWYATGWRPKNPRIRAETGQMLRFGLNLAGFNFMNFFSRNLDNIVVAKAFGPESLGYYDRSYRLLLAPLGNINSPVSRIILPILGRLRDEPGRYRIAYLQAASLLTWLCVPGIAALAIVAKDFVPLLLGPRWAPAAPIFAWLGIAGVGQPLGNATGWLFTTQHRTNDMFHWGVFAATVTIISFFVGLPWGVKGVAAAYALSSLLIRLPVLIIWVGRRGPVTSRDLFKLQAPVVVGGLLSLLTIRYIDSTFKPAPIVNVFISLIVTYGLTMAIVLAFPSPRKQFSSYLKLTLGSFQR